MVLSIVFLDKNKIDDPVAPYLSTGQPESGDCLRYV